MTKKSLNLEKNIIGIALIRYDKRVFYIGLKLESECMGYGARMALESKDDGIFVLDYKYFGSEKAISNEQLTEHGEDMIRNFNLRN